MLLSRNSWDDPEILMAGRQGRWSASILAVGAAAVADVIAAFLFVNWSSSRPQAFHSASDGLLARVSEQVLTLADMFQSR